MFNKKSDFWTLNVVDISTTLSHAHDHYILVQLWSTAVTQNEQKLEFPFLEKVRLVFLAVGAILVLPVPLLLSHIPFLLCELPPQKVQESLRS